MNKVHNINKIIVKIFLFLFSNQLAINTAIVYVHRFYMHHPFNRFHRNSIAPAALFLAAKVEEQPRKLEHVIKIAHLCLNRESHQLETNSEVSVVHLKKIFFFVIHIRFPI